MHTRSYWWKGPKGGGGGSLQDYYQYLSLNSSGFVIPGASTCHMHSVSGMDMVLWNFTVSSNFSPTFSM